MGGQSDSTIVENEDTFLATTRPAHHKVDIRYVECLLTNMRARLRRNASNNRLSQMTTRVLKSVIELKHALDEEFSDYP